MDWNDYENLRKDQAAQGITLPSIEGLIIDSLASGSRLLNEQIVHFIASRTAIFPWEVNGRINSVLVRLSNEYKIAQDYQTGCWYQI